jgi:plasmid stabilization system protein ParE
MTISKSLSAGQARTYHNAAVHDAWFRAKVQEALDDPRPATPHEKVEAHFAMRRLAAYRIAGDTVRILRVLHGAQLWPEEMREETKAESP